MKNLSTIVVATAFAVTLGQLTIHYVTQFVTPSLAYWILYFIISLNLIKRYEKRRRKKAKNKELKSTNPGEPTKRNLTDY